MAGSRCFYSNHLHRTTLHTVQQLSSLHHTTLHHTTLHHSAPHYTTLVYTLHYTTVHHTTLHHTTLHHTTVNTTTDDANIIAKLRKVGAIVLGKANVAEWLQCSSQTMSTLASGWCRNPYDVDAIKSCGADAVPACLCFFPTVA